MRVAALTAVPEHTQEVDRWLFPGISESDSAEQADKQSSGTAAEDEARPDPATESTEKAIDHTSAKDDTSQDPESKITRKGVEQSLRSEGPVADFGNGRHKAEIDSPSSKTSL
jgi:hypothetical protein